MHAFLALSAFLAAQDKSAEKPPEKPAATIVLPQALKLEIGGQVRVRAEYRDPLAYNNPAATAKNEMEEDQDLLLERVRLNLRFSLADQIEVFFQPQDQRTFGDEASVLSDEANLDVHQGWVEMRDLMTPGFSIRIGRQELSYGDQRLVSPLDWSNIARAWDGLKLRYAGDGWWAEGFYTVIKEVLGAEDDQDFYGLYASYTGVAAHEFDLYVFGRQLDDNLQPSETVVAAVNDRSDWTAGLRLKGKAAGFDYSAEAMLQRGEVGDDDVESSAWALTLGYTVDHEWKPRIGIEATVASGDDDPTDGEIGTFDPLFPFGHFYQGFADVFAFRNGRDLVLHLQASPAPSFSLHLDVHSFRLVEEEDAWYNFAGAAIRRDATGNAGDEVGEEIDLHARLAVGKHLKFWGGWSHFLPGSFVEDTPGTERSMDWFFLQAVVDF
jgi:hypothetical protein